MGQEINGDVYDSQRQPNCFMIRSLSTARKCGRTRNVDFLPHGVLTPITAVFRKEETKLKGDTEGSSDWLFSGVSGKLGEKPLLRRLGIGFAIFISMGLWGLPILG